jgi:uroporphyrinogen decarboxylase
VAERENIQSYGLFTLERWERVMKSDQRLRTLCAMDKRARVLAALRGEAVDRVPISFWGHHYVAENSAEGLAGETLRQLQRFDWDFLKPQSRAQAFAEMWGLTYTPSSLANVKYATSHLPLSGAADLAGLKPADPGKGALGEQIEALHRIRASVGASVPIVWTVFSPLMIARYLLLGDAAQVVQVARSDPGALAHALEAITDTLLGYVRAILASGADGIFYATNLATRDLLTVEECERFQRPYDLRVLAEAASAPFNVMHVCGQDALFDAFVDYPVAAFSFALGPTNPTLADAHRRSGKAVMGGVPAALATLTAAEVAGHARAAVDDMARRWLLLAPGCSVAIDTPDELLLAAREVAHTARSD